MMLRVFLVFCVWGLCGSTLVRAQAARADLQILDLKVNPTSVAVNGTFTVSFKVYNNGGAAAKASQTLVALSTNNTISEADTILARVATTAIASKKSQTVQLTLFAGGVNPGTFTLGVVADIKKAITESRESNNVARARITVTKAALPDLQVSTLTPSSTRVYKGQTLTVALTIRNAGSGTSGNTVGGLYLSSNNYITIADRQLKTFAIPGLKAGDSWKTSVQVTIPANQSSGRIYLGVLANLSLNSKSPPDRQGRITESNIKNNTRAVQLTVGAPDLVVRNLFVQPRNFKAGDTITLSFQILNQGSVDAGASSVRLFFSKDKTITTGDRPVKTEAVNFLRQAASQSFSIKVTVTAAMMQGFPSSFHVGAFVDPDKKVPESNESNNTVSTQVNVSGIDLVPTILKLDQAAYDPNATATLSITVVNNGNKPSTQTTIDIVYATNAALNTNRRRLGTITLPALKPGETKVLPARVIVPSTASPGTIRYLGVEVDAQKSNAELDENNNRLVQSFRVGYTDLQAVSLTLSPTSSRAGGTVTATWNVRNAGSKALNASKGTFYLSKNTSLSGATMLKSVVIPALKAGESHSNTMSLTLPAVVPLGRAYILFFADSGRTLRENNEGNNVRNAALTISENVDLVPTSFKLSATTVQRNQKVTFTLIVSNKGTKASNGFYSPLRYSQNSNFTTSDPRLANPPISSLPGGTLGAGQSKTLTGTIVIPANATYGTGYIFVHVDEQGYIGETNENNNKLAIKITVQAPGKPDLQVSTLHLSSTNISPGGSITSNTVIRNAGTATAAASEARLYLSTKSTVVNGSPLILTMGIASLGAGKSQPNARVLTFPKTVKPGRYYLVAVADVGKKVAESNENNNTRSIVVNIITTDPDNDGDGFPASKDCNDKDKAINPKAREVCDGLDNNCNAKVDEGTLCPNGYICSQTQKRCVRRPTEPGPEPVTDGGPADVSPPDMCGFCKPNELCVNNACRENNCYDLKPCKQGEVCLNARCTPNPCNNVKCKDGEFCRLGVCVESCAGIQCKTGEKCADGKCVQDLCDGVNCSVGDRCDPATGRCQSDLCASVTCGKGRVCEQGKCVDKACATVTCPTGQLCKEGQCTGKPPQEPTQNEGPDDEFPDSDAGGKDSFQPDNTPSDHQKNDVAVKDKTSGDTDNGGTLKELPLPSDGCLCQSNSPWSGSSGFLMLLFFLWFQRRRRK
jgi:subtilase family serine protease